MDQIITLFNHLDPDYSGNRLLHWVFFLLRRISELDPWTSCSYLPYFLVLFYGTLLFFSQLTMSYRLLVIILLNYVPFCLVSSQLRQVFCSFQSLTSSIFTLGKIYQLKVERTEIQNLLDQMGRYKCSLRIEQLYHKPCVFLLH